MADKSLELEIVQNETKTKQQEEEYGVLLYYKYTTISDIQNLYDFYHSNCTSLSLLGRVRLSSHGVNVTVGGKLKALEKHIEAVKSNALFEGTDFKLASCQEPIDDKVARECGFTSLSIRIVKELVTLSSHPLLNSPDISNAGRHLSAAEFHTVLQDAGRFQEPSKKLVVVDARNLYETRIGKFHPPNIETLDPEIRQYSDLPTWIDNNSEKLRGNNILMYCTGGIRCEMASAYIRSKGAGFENVFQLYGGIQRYLEQFPDGGFFKGKNFVFDHRVSVGSLDTDILGTCLLCDITFDDYSSRSRCTHCRMLVLVCDTCRENSSSYVCELCQKNGKSLPSFSAVEDGISEDTLGTPAAEANAKLDPVSSSPPSSWRKEQDGAGVGAMRKLRIICLHGFRQNASSFKGRTASLAKKLKNIAELVFVDAPHELPFIYQPSLPAQNNFSEDQCQQTPPVKCNRKFAWLVAHDYNGKGDTEWKVAQVPFDSFQYQQQTDGLEQSLEYLKTIFIRNGPFDGVLGFSQGAAMAALFCAQEKIRDQVDFRFVILCSGFSVNMSNYPKGSIDCPSLHIFGSSHGQDRQIDNQASRELVSFFDNRYSVVIEHDFGHIIPTRSPYIDEIKDFLLRFL